MSFLNKKIIDFSETSFGLDLSDLSVKVISLENNGGKYKIAGYNTVSIARGSVVNGEIVKRENVSLAIKKAIEKASPKSISIKKVNCSLPEEKAFLRVINVPKMNKSEAKEAIKWEVEANIPLSIDQVYYDWQILDKQLGGKQNEMSVLVVAVSRSSVDAIIDVVETSGLEVVGMEIESVCQARSLLGDVGDNETSLIVDLGDRRTSFLVSVGNVPVFTSSIHVSGQGFTDAISKGMNLSIEEAEKLKISNGIGSFINEDPIYLSVKPLLDGLASEIEKSIDFYLTELKYSKNINKIILCGGGANTKGLVPYLSRALNYKIEVGNPWSSLNLRSKLPIIEKEQSIHFSTAIGLAIKGINMSEYENIS